MTPSPSQRSEVDRIDRHPVTSSLIAGLGYDPRWRVLAVEFKDGSIFHYANVPEDIYTQMMEAGSIGSAYGGLVRGKFSATKMTGECPKCGNGPGIIGETCDSCGCDVYEPECGERHPIPTINAVCKKPRRHAERHLGKHKRQIYEWLEENEVSHG